MASLHQERDQACRLLATMTAAMERNALCDVTRLVASAATKTQYKRIAELRKVGAK